MRHVSTDGFASFFRHRPQAKVLDVRCAHEFEARGHRKGDHHVPWYTPDWKPNPNFIEHVLQHISPEDYVLVICRNGDRSCEAAKLLETAGFQHVYNVLGGYEDIRETRRTRIVASNHRMIVQQT